MIRKLFIINLHLILFTFPLYLNAQYKTIEISDNNDFINLIDKVEIYLEDNVISPFEEIKNSNEFKENTKNFYLDYFNTKILWVRFSIKNSCEDDRQFILEIPNATINDLTFYSESNPGEYNILRTGASFPFSTRDIKTRYFSFDVNIPPGETRNFFFNINTEEDAMNLPLVLWKSVPYINKTVNERYFLGIYYGAITFIIIFHLFLFYKFRDKALVFYMIYVAGFAGYQLYMDGFASKYLLPDFPNVAKRSLTIFAYTCFWSMIIFIQLYLNTSRLIPLYDRFLNVVKWTLFICLLGCFISYKSTLFLSHLLNFLGPLSTFFVIVGAILCYKQEPALSKYLIIAFSFLIAGIFLEVTKNTGVVYSSDYGLKIGHSLEAIILAFALAVRFKINNEATQNLAMERLHNLNQLKDQYNSELENTVALRTEELNVSNKNLNDSILYARHIQHSIMPSRTLLKDYFPEHFIFIKPKDIISGDFYWFEKVGDTIVMAVVDCTGHGVPGAFMSLLGSTILRQVVKIDKITQPEEILQLMDREIRCTLKQNDDDPFNKDGMDLSLITYCVKNRTIKFCGARRPLIIIDKKGKIEIFKGDKHSLGGDLAHTHSKEFVSQLIPAGKGDSIYLFTDGILDQFGGRENKKFKMNKFKELLIQLSDLPLSKQGELIEAEVKNWQGKYEQVDDILVMGIKLN